MSKRVVGLSVENHNDCIVINPLIRVETGAMGHKGNFVFDFDGMVAFGADQKEQAKAKILEWLEEVLNG